MPWYRVGTVAITAGQTTVTGTNTNFALNARVGDAFQGPDGRWYEVANIASATVLSILPAYQGATVAAGSYGLAPMQGYVKDLADRARQMIDQWGTTLASIGAVATENVVPVAKGGTGGTTAADGRAGLGLWLTSIPLTANVSANTLREVGRVYYVQGSTVTDIPEALTGFLEVKASGDAGLAAYRNVQEYRPYMTTGKQRVWTRTCLANSTTPNWTAWERADIHSVIERSSNANGEYTKFSDGTLICRRFVADYAISCAVGATSTSPLIPFPVPFVASPSVSIQGFVTDAPGNPLSIPLNDSSLGNLSNWRFDMRNTSSTAVTRVAGLNLLAIGRWS
jgi:hypothetical protein